MITNAQLVAGSQLTIVNAPGPGKYLVPISASAEMNYGGTNAFTNEPVIQLKVGTAITHATVASAPNIAFWQGTSNQLVGLGPQAIPQSSSAAWENAAMTWNMSVGTTGNAAMDNTAAITVTFFILSDE